MKQTQITGGPASGVTLVKLNVGDARLGDVPIAKESVHGIAGGAVLERTIPLEQIALRTPTELPTGAPIPAQLPTLPPQLLPDSVLRGGPLPPPILPTPRLRSDIPPVGPIFRLPPPTVAPDIVKATSFTTTGTLSTTNFLTTTNSLTTTAPLTTSTISKTTGTLTLSPTLTTTSTTFLGR